MNIMIQVCTGAIGARRRGNSSSLAGGVGGGGHMWMLPWETDNQVGAPKTVGVSQVKWEWMILAIGSSIYKKKKEMRLIIIFDELQVT